MNKKFSGGWLWLVLLTACSSNEGGDKQVGGGQSGTEGQGAYSCQLDSPIIESIPNEVAPAGVACSPDAGWKQFEGGHVFECTEHDVSFTVNVTRGSSARRLTGKRYSDTDANAPPTDCQAMSLDASVEIGASDGNVDFAGPTTLTVDHLCVSAKIESKVQGPEGEFSLEFFKDDLFVIYPNASTEHCIPKVDTAAHGDGAQ